MPADEKSSMRAAILILVLLAALALLTRTPQAPHPENRDAGRAMHH